MKTAAAAEQRRLQRNVSGFPKEEPSADIQHRHDIIGIILFIQFQRFLSGFVALLSKTLAHTTVSPRQSLWFIANPCGHRILTIQQHITITRRHGLTEKHTSTPACCRRFSCKRLAMGKQSKRLNKAAQHRKESNYIVVIYNEKLFPPSVMHANTQAPTLFNI